MAATSRYSLHTAFMTSFEHLGPYKLGELLGRGGMGSVYAAVHEKTGDRVAVKLIAQQVSDEMRFRRRFAGEIETLRRLRHKSIVQLFGYGEEQGHLFYAMELVEGESLQQRLRREKRLAWQPTMDIAIQVCSALKHAHDVGAIHRDLKPANLLLTPDGTVKLVDFGIAKLFGFGEQTLAGSVLGTADYMAPEQAGTGPISSRTDLYALGSVMYAMLAGRPPFTGKRLTEVIESVKRSPPIPLDMINPELPEALVELVQQLLEKDPEDRPPTALSVMKRLKAMRAGLQREQTLHQGSFPTESGQAKPAPDPDVTRVPTTPIAAGTGLSSEEHTESGNHGTVATSRRLGTARHGTPDDVTIATSELAAEDVSAQSTMIPPDPAVKPPQTHFQSVDATRSPDHAFGRSESGDGYWWIQLLSVAAMILILIGGIALFVWAVRTPPANTLYERILAADQAGDFLAERALVKQFMENYPDDHRMAAVEELNASLELENYLRQLRTRANRIGGVEQLPPGQQAFLEAMSLRGRRPDVASRQLENWIAVFGVNVERADLNLYKMNMFAKLELERLEQQRQQADARAESDNRATELHSQIAWAKDNLPPNERRDMFQGIVELFGTKPWAASAVRSAQEELAGLASREQNSAGEPAE